MATAPKTAPKAAPKIVPMQETVEETPAPVVKKSRKKWFLILATLLILAGGGGTAWYLLGEEAPPPDGEAAPVKVKLEPPKPPVYLPLEQFTVNLQSDGTGDQFLQLSFTLEVADDKQVEQLKLYLPLVRSRLLLLLSSKKAADLNTAEGKKKLAADIIAQVKQPFTPQSPPVGITGVYFTSFVIQ